MAYPDSLDLVALTGTILTTGGAPAAGTVTITTDAVLQGPADDVVVTGISTVVQLDANGSFSVVLPATDSPGWTPQDFTYQVAVAAAGRRFLAYIELPAANPVADLADVLQLEVPPSAGVIYIPLSQRGAANGVATLGSDGKVPADQLPAGSGGSDPDKMDVNGGEGFTLANGSVVRQQSTTRTDVGFSYTGNGAGFEVYKATDADRPGHVVMLFGGTPAAAFTAMHYYNGAYTPVIVADSGGATVTGDLEVSAQLAVHGNIALDGTITGLDWTEIENRPAIPAAATVARATVTSGNISATAHGSWTVLAGLSLSLAAAVGDDVELYVGALMDAGSGIGDGFEMVVVGAGGAVARFGSTGTATPSDNGPGEGDPANYPNVGQRFQPFSAIMSFTVTSGDLTGGNVVFGIAHKGTGGGAVLASAAYPFRWRARNDH